MSLVCRFYVIIMSLIELKLIYKHFIKILCHMSLSFGNSTKLI